MDKPLDPRTPFREVYQHFLTILTAHFRAGSRNRSVDHLRVVPNGPSSSGSKAGVGPLESVHPQGQEVSMMMYGWDFAGTNGWMMVVGMAIVAATILISVWLIIHRPGTHVSADATPIDILHARFATGEITREQFEDAKWAID